MTRSKGRTCDFLVGFLIPAFFSPRLIGFGLSAIARSLRVGLNFLTTVSAINSPKFEISKFLEVADSTSLMEHQKDSVAQSRVVVVEIFGPMLTFSIPPMLPRTDLVRLKHKELLPGEAAALEHPNSSDSQGWG